MNQSSVVYQRSEEGFKEIIRRRHGLTQSERLVLIMVDGVSSASDIRAKLKALTDDRFWQAVDKLRSLGLVDAIVVVPKSPSLEEVAQEIAELLRRQELLDSVTIVGADPVIDSSSAANEKNCASARRGSTAPTDLALQEWSPRAGWHLSQAARVSRRLSSAIEPSSPCKAGEPRRRVKQRLI